MSKNICTFSCAGVHKCPQAHNPTFSTQSLCNILSPNMLLWFPLTPCWTKASLYLMHRNNLGVNLHSKLWRITCHWKTHSVREPPVSTHKNCEKLNHIISRLKCFHYNRILQGVCYLILMYVPYTLYIVFISTKNTQYIYIYFLFQQ